MLPSFQTHRTLSPRLIVTFAGVIEMFLSVTVFVVAAPAAPAVEAPASASPRTAIEVRCARQLPWSVGR